MIGYHRQVCVGGGGPAAWRWWGWVYCILQRRESVHLSISWRMNR